MLCEEAVATGKGIIVGLTGEEARVLCCPACYAMFSDFVSALRLMPSSRRKARSAARSVRAVVAESRAISGPSMNPVRRMPSVATESRCGWLCRPA